MVILNKGLFYIFIFLISLICLQGCKTTSKISQADALISAKIDLINVVHDRVKVELTVPKIDTDTISYHLPKIVPGTYSNNNYGKFINDLKAFDTNGNLLKVIKKGVNTWQIQNARKLASLSYWVDDTFDTEEEHSIFSPTGSNIEKDKNFILNLYAFIGYFEPLKESKYKIQITHPEHLEASSTTSYINKQSNTKDIYTMKRYAEVVDSPIMYAVPDRILFTVKDMEVLISVYSPNGTHRAAKLLPEMERMIRAQKYFLGDMNTTKKYSILLYLSPSKGKNAKGYGALEHFTSTVVVLPESILLDKLNEALTDIVSHEFFHIVTPIQIHSKEIHYFDYNSPKMSQHIWMYEGTTEYFSLLFQINQGLISKEVFFERLLEKIDISATFSDRSFTEMSTRILEDQFQKEYRNVYEKGALISMCIDIIIREQSNGEFGILDLIKKLSLKYGSDRPFDDKSLLRIIKKMSYPEVGKFLENHVVQANPIDYETYLKKVGVLYNTKAVPSTYFIYEQQPYIKGLEASKEVVFCSGIPMNSFFKSMGIQGGDILMSINGKKYHLNNIYDLFKDSNRWKLNDEVTFVIKRNGVTKTLKTNVIEPIVQKKILKYDDDATEQQSLLFKNWVNE